MRLVTGEVVTITVDVPPGTPLSEIEVPGVIVNEPAQPAEPAPTPPTPRRSPSPPPAPRGGNEQEQARTRPAQAEAQARGRRVRSTLNLWMRVLRIASAPSAIPLRNSDGSPTPTNPGFFDALPGPSTATGVPNFVIRKFRVPIFLLPIYQAAGIQYGIRWEILAAINEIETDYGRNLNVSSRGRGRLDAVHPVESWKAYGVDANKDGVKDPYNPVDAIFAAARYLDAAGYEQDVRRAIFAYNHADWYVDSVMLRARLIAGVPADLVGSLTGLTEGRFPVYARARYADDLAEQEALRRVKPGSERRQRDRVRGQPARDRDLLAPGRAGRGRQRRCRQEDRPLEGARPLPGAPGRVRQPLHLRPARRGVQALPGPGRGRDRPAPLRAGAVGQRQRSGADRPGVRGPPGRELPRGRPRAQRPRASVPVKERLFAHPDLRRGAARRRARAAPRREGSP